MFDVLEQIFLAIKNKFIMPSVLPTRIRVCQSIMDNELYAWLVDRTDPNCATSMLHFGFGKDTSIWS